MTSDSDSCKIEGCKRPYRAKGYCNVHYQKWRCGELPHPRYRTCVQEECHKRVFQKSLCEEHFRAHYPKLAKKLLPEAPEAAPPPEAAAPVVEASA